MVRPFTSLYVHVPFCEAKCDYCAFYSVEDTCAGMVEAYLEAVVRDLRAARCRCGPMQSVYVGGGTPSALPAESLATLLGLIREQLTLAPGAEFTVEANPNSLSRDKIGVLARRGVNRVSLGIQSFSARLRRLIGRRGGLEALPDVLDALRTVGIDNIGLDLIYAIPGETLGEWQEDLEKALALNPSHISTYELTVEEGTPLSRRALPAVEEELSVEMWRMAGRILRQAGIRRYEVSNLARPGCQCRHNMDVWHGATYLGCGPAAASFDGQVRTMNPRDLRRWLAGAPPEEDRLPPLKRAAELLGLGLRTLSGWARQEFRQRTGMDYAEIRGEALEELAGEGLLKITEDAVRPTERGLLFADHVADRLL